MSNEQSVHIPVLLAEVLKGIGAERGGLFLDCTFGGGGHSRAILDLCDRNKVVACDRDQSAVNRASAWSAQYADRLKLYHSPFSEILKLVGGERFDGVLADLGLSTDQLRAGRGFSFADLSLDMRMDISQGVSAAELLNQASEQELFLALARGGVGNFARPIAKRIIQARPIVSAAQLAELVASSGLGKQSAVHPATVVFQALRIAVNQEFAEIESLLNASRDLVKPGANLVVISFHSLEDQVVTKRLRSWEQGDTYPANWRGPRPEVRSIGKLLTKKAILAGDEEREANPSSRSARLRVFRFNDF